jgi:hypothetical protein
MVHLCQNWHLTTEVSLFLVAEIRLLLYPCTACVVCYGANVCSAGFPIVKTFINA